MARTRGRSNRHLAWEGNANPVLALAAGVGSAVQLSPVTFPRTMIRIRGEVFIEIDGAASDGELVLVTCGLVWHQQDVAITGQSPFSDADASWVWWSGHCLSGEGVTEGNAGIGRSIRVPVDNKAMRKVGPDDELTFVAENTSLVSTASVNVVPNLRYLFQS